MSFQINISAGELFELIRPAAFVLATLVSTWVFASARRRRFSFYQALGWAIGTLFFPLIVLPLYLLARFARKQPVSKQREPTDSGNETIGARTSTPRLRVVAPLAYAAVVFAGISLYLYLDYQGVDAHLARAAHAKLRGNRGETIEQYRQALELEDNPHIHKLLGIELANARYWTDALSEFRLAELGGEPDESIPYYIATLLVALNQPSQAALEYQKFLQAKMCTQALPDDRCEVASRFISGGI